MASQMPPIPPANRRKGTPSEAKQAEEELVQHEHHGNASEKGDTANIKQNTTNAGYFKGRRMKSGFGCVRKPPPLTSLRFDHAQCVIMRAQLVQIASFPSVSGRFGSQHLLNVASDGTTQGAARWYVPPRRRRK